MPARDCMNRDELISRMITVEIQYAQLFQQSEILSQQIRLLDTNPETQGLPQITNITFWSHLYRKVALDPNNLNATIVSIFHFNIHLAW